MFEVDGGVDGGVDGLGGRWCGRPHYILVMYPQSLIYYFIIACRKFLGERRGGRWVDYAVVGGVDAFIINLLCTDNGL